MDQKFFSLTAIMDELLNEYASVGPNDKDNLRKKIEKVCRGITVEGEDLWTKSAVPRGGKTRHQFTQYQKSLIINSEELIMYILERKSPEKFKEYNEAMEELRKVTKAEREMRESEHYIEDMESDTREAEEDREHNPVKLMDVNIKKYCLMLEALYLKFFEPIDLDELYADMVSSAVTTDNATVKAIISDKHLKLGPAYYCKEKKDPEDDS